MTFLTDDFLVIILSYPP